MEIIVMTRRMLPVLVALVCGCNSLYLLGAGEAGESTGTGSGSSTGVMAPTTEGVTETSTEGSTTLELMLPSSSGQASTSTSTSTSTGETSTSTGETSTSTGETGTITSGTGDETDTVDGGRTARIVFLTSRKFNGAMKPKNKWWPEGIGLDGADQQCQKSAPEGHEGTFKAWLSDNFDEAQDRMTDDDNLLDAPLEGPGGQPIADNWSHFVDAESPVTIMWTENGLQPEDHDYRFWSGSSHDGSLADQHSVCLNWLFSLGRQKGVVGDGGDWSASGTRDCDTYHRLLCIQTSFDPPANP